ncbi:MAG: NTP transferase domain-containing protein [Oscillospiraceae bacterium]|nr:NTP transferase domain-containing protein [Oscillospiraceae bacterium]
MKNAVILCAGEGTKFWPYASVRCKVMMPISNKPIVAYSVDALVEMGFENIVIVGNRFIEEIVAYFRDDTRVKVIADDKPKGTAFSLLKARDLVDGDFLALHGDTIAAPEDLRALADTFTSSGENTALVDVIRDRTGDVIGCDLSDGCVSGILGHPRGKITHFFGGFALKHSFFDSLKFSSNRFRSTEVGMMVPVESYLESALEEEMRRGMKLLAVEAKQRVFDIDKPWHVLDANSEINSRRCGALTKNELAQGASIDPTAVIGGFVKLGKNSTIGKNVIIEGNIIVGDNTEIKNGAIVSGDVVIGDECKIRNACFIEGATTIGNECIVSHAAEVDGVILDRVYLYHYMEWGGIIGTNTDLGAATVCGSLRFDDFITMQKVKGRREFHRGSGDAVFLGDYCRTGVNAILMPGVKVGVYSVVGAGVTLNKDVPDRTLIYNEQTLVERTWGPEKYGW